MSWYYVGLHLLTSKLGVSCVGGVNYPMPVPASLPGQGGQPEGCPAARR